MGLPEITQARTGPRETRTGPSGGTPCEFCPQVGCEDCPQRELPLELDDEPSRPAEVV